MKSVVVVAVILLSQACGLAVAQQAGSSGARQVVSKVVPAYPDLARRLNLQGIVKLEVTVQANGSVKSARVAGGNPVLADSALDAVRAWKFEPSTGESTELIELRFDKR